MHPPPFLSPTSNLPTDTNFFELMAVSLNDSESVEQTAGCFIEALASTP